jgi:inner membrane protein
MKGIGEHSPVVKLKSFTKEYFAMADINGSVTMRDLRMGSEPDYVFQFKVAELEKTKKIPTKPTRLQAIRDWSQLPWLWARIWSKQDNPE